MQQGIQRHILRGGHQILGTLLPELVAYGAAECLGEIADAVPPGLAYLLIPQQGDVRPRRMVLPAKSVVLLFTSAETGITRLSTMHKAGSSADTRFLCCFLCRSLPL